ncbi:MAG: putative Ig domain-containing protein [Planctomycetia bacterium]|nr:putative Ig domain-containing protein [Planctomycetia bacterium]
MNRRKPSPMAKFHSLRMEPLENRLLLSVNTAPTLDILDDSMVENLIVIPSGSPYYLVLDSTDADGDAIQYDISFDNNLVEWKLLESEQNRSIAIDVQQGDKTGRMTFQLLEELAPKTTARILELIESGYYNSSEEAATIFHRVIENFMIQAGNKIDAAGNVVSTGTGQSFDDEFSEWLRFTQGGLLAMANAGDDTNDSQFFITSERTAWLDYQHSIFGVLTDGKEVQEWISGTETNSSNRPTEDVVIESISVIQEEGNPAILLIDMPENATGSTTLTISVDDGHGGVTQKEVTLTFVVDTNRDQNARPFFTETTNEMIVEMESGGTVSVNLEAFDKNSSTDQVFYYASSEKSSEQLSVSVNNATGEMTVTAEEGFSGIGWVFVAVTDIAGLSYSSSQSSYFDTQYIPVYVSPQAPSAPVFIPQEGTAGETVTEEIREWTFLVEQVVPGATVELYINGEKVVSQVATEESIRLTTPTDSLWSAGDYEILAVQVLEEVAVKVNNYQATTDLRSSQSASSTLTVVYNGTPPAVVPVEKQTVKAGQTLEIPIQATSEESGAVLKYSLVGENLPEGVSLDASTGLFSWKPDVDSESQSVTFTIAVEDSLGGKTEITFDVEVQALEKPVFNLTETEFQVEEETLFTLDVTAQGAETESHCQVTVLESSLPEGAVFDSETGRLSWTPTESQGPGTYEITFTATSADGVTAEQRVRIVVREVNLPPIFQEIGALEGEEFEELLIQLVGQDAETPAERLVYSLESGPEGMTIDSQTGQIRWTPQEIHGNAQFTITVGVTDEAGAQTTQEITIFVREKANAPVLTGGENLPERLFPGDILDVTFQATDPDVSENQSAAEIVLAVKNLPEGAVFDATTGTLRWEIGRETPTGKYTLEISATKQDGSGLTTTRVLTVEVWTQIVTDSPVLEWGISSRPEAFRAISELPSFAYGERIPPVSQAVSDSEGRGSLGYRLSLSSLSDSGNMSGGSETPQEGEKSSDGKGETPPQEEPGRAKRSRK